jgi:hypothetical protein
MSMHAGSSRVGVLLQSRRHRAHAPAEDSLDLDRGMFGAKEHLVDDCSSGALATRH